MNPEWVTPVLPTRALLVAPTVEGAAVLGTAFEEAVAAPLDEVAALLATEGHDLPCVAVTGIPTRGGRLAAVITHVLDACPENVQVVLAATGSIRADLADGGVEALRGLAPVDLVQLSGVPCLRLRRAPERGERPDLGGLLSQLEVENEVPARLAAEAEALLARAGDPALRAQLGEIQAALDDANRELTAARAERAEAHAQLARLQSRAWGRWALAATRGQSSGPATGLAQLRRRGGALGLGVAGVAAVAVLLAAATGTGYVGAVVTAVLGVAVLQLAYTWRAQRRARAGLDRAVAAGQDALTARAQVTERRLSELSTRITRLERNLAIVTASSVDTAQSVAKVADRMRAIPPDLGPG